MKTSIFDSFDPTSTISFLSTSKLARDTKGIHEGAELSPLHFSMKKPVVAALNYCIAIPSGLHNCGEERTMTTYGEEVKYLLEFYATDGVIAEMDAKFLISTQPSHMMPIKYAEALKNKASRCNRF